MTGDKAAGIHCPGRRTRRQGSPLRQATDVRAAEPIEHTFADRIEAEIRRGKIDSPAAEERAQLEHWLIAGAPTPGTPAERFGDSQPAT